MRTISMRCVNPFETRTVQTAVGHKPIHKNNIGTKMTMSTTSVMTPRIHRKVLRAPSKLHPGKMHHLHYSGKLRHPGKGGHYSGKASNYAGKLSSSLGKPGSGLMHSSKIANLMTHSGKASGKMGHYQGKAYHIHTERNARGKGVPTTFHHPESVCDNSNDSGIGFDHHSEFHSRNLLRSTDNSESSSWNVTVNDRDVKRRKTDIKFESDDAIDNFPFPETATDNATTLSQTSTHLNVTNKLSLACPPRGGRRLHAAPVPAITTPPTLASPLQPQSKDGKVSLQIICQPEQQHRARYQTEGSRGAVKDRSGNGFPVVKLVGYSKPAVLQVFIGTDVGRVAPHMFYQACRVSGKNSTPCSEKKVDGTVLIEIDLDPQKEWQATCDCVGILKERNVDVEHRFGEQSGQRLKKKSTRCRMVFRAQLMNEDGSLETIQVTSQQIACTQPPGIPEICKKSLVSCPANGGLELFLLGKNFLKDTRVVFRSHNESSSSNNSSTQWEELVTPDKEYLQQNHLICAVPPYVNPNIQDSVSVKLFVMSGGKCSEHHKFIYTPLSQSTGPQHATPHYSPHGILTANMKGDDLKEENSQCTSNTWEGNEVGIMPPPALPSRRSSLLLPHSPTSPPLNHFKTECSDESSQSSLVENDSSDIMSYRINSFKVHNENSPDLNENNFNHIHPVMRQLSNDSVPQYNPLHINDNSNISMDNTVDVMRINENTSSMNMLMHTESTSTSKDSALIPYSQNSMLMSQMMPTASLMVPNTTAASPEMLSMSRQMSPEDIKVMDLRMKPSDIVTAADPLASFKQFVDTQNDIQNGTVPVVDPYLSSIDTKTVLSQEMEKTSTTLETFSQQMEAIQNHNTDKVMESVAAAIFHSNTEATGVGGLYSQGDTAMKQMMNVTVPLTREPTCLSNRSQPPHSLQDSMIHETNMANTIMSDVLNDAQNKNNMLEFTNTHVLNNQPNPIETLVSPPQMAMSPEIILNSQVSPTLLCPQETALATPQLLSPPLPQDDIMMLTNTQTTASDSTMSLMNSLSPTVKTPPSAVKNMILNAAAEIFTSDSTMNALVTSAINTANILTNENAQNQPTINCAQTSPVPVGDIHTQQAQQQGITGDYNFTQPAMMEKEDNVSESAVINQAVTQAVSQAVSHAVSQAVSHAVNQEMKTSTSAPMQELISMSDNDLLCYINPMLF